MLRLRGHLRRNGRRSGFNDVKYEIEQTVLFQKRDKMIRDLIADFKSKAKIDINQKMLDDYQASMTPSLSVSVFWLGL